MIAAGTTSAPESVRPDAGAPASTARPEAEHPAAQRGRDRPGLLSVRKLGIASVVLFGLLVLAQGAALVWTSRIAWTSAQRMERDTISVDESYEFDRALREYNRLSNLWIVTREPRITAARAEIETDLLDQLADLHPYVIDEAEHRVLHELEKELATYLSVRGSAENRGLELDRATRTIQPSLDRALETSARLRQSNEMNRRRSQLRAEQALRVQAIAAAASVIVLVVALTIVAVSVHRLVVRPILQLEAAVESFGSGRSGQQRPSGGRLVETRALAARFNEMTDAIGQQRQDQLTFLAAVAHDLRNPLGGLKMIVQALEREPSAATPDRFRKLDRQLDRLTRMVGDLLDATQIETGHLELRLESVDLRESAQAMVDVYAPTTSIHQVILEAPEQPLMLEADPLRLEQVVGNLLSNAIRYSPSGGPVRVSLAANDGWAELSVSDRGVGIPREELPHLFQPFRRCASASTVPRGVGLGLSTVQRIVTALGGRIEVESKVDVGSTFRVRLPLGA